MSYSMHKNDSILPQKAESLICSMSIEMGGCKKCHETVENFKDLNALTRNEENKGECGSGGQGEGRGIAGIKMS